MKIILWIVGILVGVVLLLGIVQTVASERVEVVELHTFNEARALVTTRLWMVDDENFQYLRGDAESAWYLRIVANEQFDLTRDGDTSTYAYTIRDDKIPTVNRLMKEKYTWGDTFFEKMVGGRDEAIIIELHPGHVINSQ